jgi:hypothetical protein
MRVRNTVNHEFESQLERAESVARHGGGGGGGDSANGTTWQWRRRTAAGDSM